MHKIPEYQDTFLIVVLLSQIQMFQYQTILWKVLEKYHSPLVFGLFIVFLIMQPMLMEEDLYLYQIQLTRLVQMARHVWLIQVDRPIWTSPLLEDIAKLKIKNSMHGKILEVR